MANKILRPIIDVEIIEQMTENDTVLIEQGGEIKRAKGVAGGGSGGGSAGDSNVVVVNATMNEDGTITCDMGVAEIHEKIMSGMPAIMNLTAQSGMAMVLTQTNTYQVNEDYEKLMFEQYSMDDKYAVGSNVIALTHYTVTVELDGSATMRGVIYSLNIDGKENMM